MMLKLVDFLLSPFARVAGWVIAAVTVVGMIYGKGRHDAREKIEGEANEDALRRTQEAIAAGNAAAAGELRANDGHRRD